MTIEMLTEQLALAFEELSTINKQLGLTSSALIATRLALEEVSPDRFEKAYGKYFAEPGSALIRQEREQQAYVGKSSTAFVLVFRLLLLVF
jgi:enamine deaminase RidA (YjgF/YER057c/UK114 family)